MRERARSLAATVVDWLTVCAFYRRHVCLHHSHTHNHLQVELFARCDAGPWTPVMRQTKLQGAPVFRKNGDPLVSNVFDTY